MPEQKSEHRAGIGVDAAGNQVIDPTKNVLDLVSAGRDADAKLREADLRYFERMREADTRRIDDMAALRVYYDNIIEGMRAESIKLLAESVKENKAEAGTRMALMEQYRWETGGKSLGISGVIVIIATGLSILIAFGGLAVAVLRP